MSLYPFVDRTPPRTGSSYSPYRQAIKSGQKAGRFALDRYEEYQKGVRARRQKKYDEEWHSANKKQKMGFHGPSGGYRVVTNALVTKSSKSVTGRNIVHDDPDIRVSKSFSQKVRKVLENDDASGKYTVTRGGYIGNILAISTDANPGFLTDISVGMVVRNVVTWAPGNWSAGMRTWFNALVQYTTASAVVNTVGDTSLNFFTPSKILDAASVLFNNKSPALGEWSTAANLSTRYNEATGVPVPSFPGDLKINVKMSSVVFTMKNVSNRVMNIDIWECCPKLKFEGDNPLGSMINCSTIEVDGGGVDSRIGYFNAGVARTQPHYDPQCLPGIYKGWKFTGKRHTMVLGPEETCVHTIYGPSGVLDYGELLVEAVPQHQNLVKGWSVSCLISCYPDLALDNLTGEGGRYVFQEAAAGNPKLSSPIVVEYVEKYDLQVPEIAGFVSNATAAGGTQLLNIRKDKIIIANTLNRNNLLYTVSSEENPLVDIAVATQLN